MSISNYNRKLADRKESKHLRIVKWVDPAYAKYNDRVVVECGIHGIGSEWGNPWVPSPHSLLGTRRGCPKCSSKYRHTDEESILLINSQRTSRFVSWVGEFNGTKSRANLSCTTCSHTWGARIDKITTGLRGCPKCGHAGGYRHSTFEKKPELINKPCDLYYIKFSKPGEVDYYKIGLDTTGRRWGSVYYGWEVEEIWRKELTLRDAFEEEQLILEKNAHHKGYPEDLYKKPGYTEMFKEDIYG